MVYAKAYNSQGSCHRLSLNVGQLTKALLPPEPHWYNIEINEIEGH